MLQASNPIVGLLDGFYRCLPFQTGVDVAPLDGTDAGFFSLEPGTVGFGRMSGIRPASMPSAVLPEARAQRTGQSITLPFDPAEVIANLQMERYKGEFVTHHRSVVRDIYYLFRPLMPVQVRKHLQRLSLHGWDQISFPQWPVDLTVERIYEWLLAVTMQACGVKEIPFIWFWPDGHSACASMTHDVETVVGRNFCADLMNLNDSFRIKSSFQIVPEQRYEVSPEFLESIRQRGFEVNVHDLNHDGRLFSSTRQEFMARVAKINRYGREFAARGFRSAVLYRRQEWMNELDFAYDMSVPNVAHLDPQRGGCCTVLPFFLGELLEIPVTTIQDYSLFHILGDYSIGIWEQQLAGISDAHGIATFIVHPDYIIESRARTVYEALLAHLAEKRITNNLWVALPGEVCDWWRARSAMRLRSRGGNWTIIGHGAERASVAYATLDDGQIRYQLKRSAESNVGAAAL
jgi:hypothetical protein